MIEHVIKINLALSKKVKPSVFMVISFYPRKSSKVGPYYYFFSIYTLLMVNLKRL